MREVSLYVNNYKLDLFNDEQIQVTSTIQNVQDISKVFTDFTQTFTVPCSKNNNAIFEHYYNTDVDATFSAQNRQAARIEINNTIFRTGKLQLESAEIKGLESDNYKVTFYGEITTLKDLFGTDKLKDLDYSTILEEFDDTTVTNAQSDTSDLDVRYPLISSNRIWEYGDASPADISTIAGKINYTELFPALKVTTILELIEAKYGITLTGLFLTDLRLDRLFTWWKNSKTSQFTLAPVLIDFAVGGSVPLSDGTFTLQYIDPTTYAPSGYTDAYTRKFINLSLTPADDCNFWIDVYNNGAYQTSLGGGSGFSATAGTPFLIQLIGGSLATNGSVYADREYQWFLRSATATTFTGTISLNIVYTYILSGVTYNSTVNQTHTDVSVTTTNDIDFSKSAPDITIAEYFTGILNTFNLTCFPVGNDLTFQVEPLQKWYEYGKEYNITQYVDDKSIQVERIKLHKAISFEYQECKSFMNQNFTGLFNRNYGDLKEQFSYDGGEFKIKLPFENLLFNKFTGTTLQVGYSMTDPEENANKSYVPKCTNLYMDRGVYNCSFYLGSQHITTYLPFGQDTNTSGGTLDYSLNFGSEQSTLKDEVIENSLFATYYLPYLENLYNPKSRRTKVKAMLPLSMLTEMTLNAKIILRDKKYMIEDIKSNLTTGEVELVLINNWTSLSNGTVTSGGTFPSGGGTTSTPVTIGFTQNGFPQAYAEIETPAESQFVTSTPSLPTTVTTSTNFEFTVPSNGTGADRTNTIPISYYDLDGTLLYTDYFVITQDRAFDYLTGGGDQLLTNTLDNLTT